MNDELVITDDTPIVSANGKREELLLALEKFKDHGLTARKKAIINKFVENFCYAYIDLAWEESGISKAQILSLNRDHCEELCNLIYERVKARAFLQKYFCQPICVCSVFGNLFIWGNFRDGNRAWNSWQYVATMEKLKKVYGKNWFPYDKIIEW